MTDVSDEDVGGSVHGFCGRGGHEELQELAEPHDHPLHHPQMVQDLHDPVEKEDVRQRLGRNVSIRTHEMNTLAIVRGRSGRPGETPPVTDPECKRARQSDVVARVPRREIPEDALAPHIREGEEVGELVPQAQEDASPGLPPHDHETEDELRHDSPVDLVPIHLHRKDEVGKIRIPLERNTKKRNP